MSGRQRKDEAKAAELKAATRKVFHEKPRRTDPHEMIVSRGSEGMIFRLVKAGVETKAVRADAFGLWSLVDEIEMNFVTRFTGVRGELDKFVHAVAIARPEHERGKLRAAAQALLDFGEEAAAHALTLLTATVTATAAATATGRLRRQRPSPARHKRQTEKGRETGVYHSLIKQSLIEQIVENENIDPHARLATQKVVEQIRARPEVLKLFRDNKDNLAKARFDDANAHESFERTVRRALNKMPPRS
jgi:hypothetical protein